MHMIAQIMIKALQLGFEREDPPRAATHPRNRTDRDHVHNQQQQRNFE